MNSLSAVKSVDDIIAINGMDFIRATGVIGSETGRNHNGKRRGT